MNNIFTKHPNSVGETYFKHFYHAMSFSFLLFLLSLKALVHAFLPFFYVTAISERLKKINNQMQIRRDSSINKN